MTDCNWPYRLTDKRVWVAGHTGMVGSAIVQRLALENCTILTVPRSRLDLRCQADVTDWVSKTAPDSIVVAAATVGGIQANYERPAEFLYDNLTIETNVINAAYQANVDRLLFIGSACIYPRGAAQPITEDALLTGALEPTNEWYSIAKIAGIKLCEAYRRQYGCNYIAAMPNNLFGPNDNFDLESSHVIPALIRKIHEAKFLSIDSLTLWGSGEPMREFMHVDDMADAAVFLLKFYSDYQHINISSGEEISIRDLAALIAEVVGWKGTFNFDSRKPDGAPQRLLDNSRLKQMGWRASTSLREGLTQTYAWYCKHHKSLSASPVPSTNTVSQRTP